MSVMLRNVNLRSPEECQFEVTQGMSICTHARTGYRRHALHEDVGTMFLGYGGRGGHCGWPFATYVFVELSA